MILRGFSDFTGLRRNNRWCPGEASYYHFKSLIFNGLIFFDELDVLANVLLGRGLSTLDTRLAVALNGIQLVL